MLGCRETDLRLCSSHRFVLIVPAEGYKHANGKAKSTGAERSRAPGDGCQPQANKHSKQRSFYSQHLFPQTRRNEVNTLRIRLVDAGIGKLWLDVMVWIQNGPVGSCFLHLLLQSQRQKWGCMKIWMVNRIQKLLSALSCTCRVKAAKAALLRGLGAFLQTSWNQTLFLMVFGQNSAPWVELDTWKLRFIFGFRQEALETWDWHLCSHWHFLFVSRCSCPKENLQLCTVREIKTEEDQMLCDDQMNIYYFFNKSSCFIYKDIQLLASDWTHEQRPPVQQLSALPGWDHFRL